MTYNKPTTPAEKEQAREYAAAKVEGLKALVSGKLEELSKGLTEGHSEAFLSYLAFSAKFHRYSPMNQILIMLQAPKAERVAGFHTWKTVGRSVNKGAKAVSILRPLLVNDKSGKLDQHGRPQKVMVGYKYVSIFADYDTSGDPLPDYMSTPGDEQTHAQLLDLIGRARAAGVSVEYRPCPPSVYGYSDGKNVVLDTLKCDSEPGTATRVFFHEWAHHVMHWDGFGVRPADGVPERQVRELEADAAAYALCSLHGVDASAQITDYIKHWGGQPDALKASMKRIMAAVKSIMTMLDPASTDAGEDSAAQQEAA